MEFLLPTAPTPSSNPWDRAIPISTNRNVTTAYLTDEIDEPFVYNELTNLLYAATADDQFILAINTPGGHLNSAIMLCDAIRNSSASVTARLSGSVCSAGTMITLACDKLHIADHTEFMIHYYSAGTYGKGSELKQRQSFMDKSLRNMYERVYAGFLTAEEIESVIEGTDIWLDAEEVRERWKLRSKK
jgi:ATP-dependent protease ClpP protease subunit